MKKLNRRQIRQMVLREMSYVFEGDESMELEEHMRTLAKLLNSNLANSPLKEIVGFVRVQDEKLIFYKDEESFEADGEEVMTLALEV